MGIQMKRLSTLLAPQSTIVDQPKAIDQAKLATMQATVFTASTLAPLLYPELFITCCILRTPFLLCCGQCSPTEILKDSDFIATETAYISLSAIFATIYFPICFPTGCCASPILNAYGRETLFGKYALDYTNVCVDIFGEDEDDKHVGMFFQRDFDDKFNPTCCPIASLVRQRG
jgi:hypothetical protein